MGVRVNTGGAVGAIAGTKVIRACSVGRGVGNSGALVGFADGGVEGGPLGTSVVRIHGRDGTGVGGDGAPVVGLLRTEHI